MPLNPSNMRVVDVARLLNSTSQGVVLAQARLYRDFNRVGFRIAAAENTRNINLIKYIAWAYDQKHAPREETGPRSYSLAVRHLRQLCVVRMSGFSVSQ